MFCLNRFVRSFPGSYPLEEFPKLQRDFIALEISFGKFQMILLIIICLMCFPDLYGNYPGLYNPETGQYGPNISAYFDIPEKEINSTGLLPYDRTHVFKIFGSYSFDFGLMLGANFTWMSGTPLNEYGAVSGWQGFSGYLVHRGKAGRTPSIWDLNFRVAYILPQINIIDYRARVLLDVFHIASKKTPVNYDQYHYFNVDENGNQIDPNPTYGRPTTFQPAMSFRFGLEVNC